MRTIKSSSQFRKDIKQVKRNPTRSKGLKILSEEIIPVLLKNGILDCKFLDHNLSGEKLPKRDCHVLNDRNYSPLFTLSTNGECCAMFETRREYIHVGSTTASLPSMVSNRAQHSPSVFPLFASYKRSSIAVLRDGRTFIAI